MPVLRFRAARVEEVLGMPLNDAVKLIERLKGEVTLHNEIIEVEYELDRPDLYTLEGIRRAAEGLLGKALGIPRYEVVDSGISIEAEDVPTRPYVLGAVVWDVDVDEYFLEELIQFQEKLHQSHGLNRSRVAIGLHDLEKLPSRRIIYRFDHIDRVRFKPLGHDKAMTAREVLSATEQGIKYGSLSLQGDRHPMLYAGDEVISMPPVINAEITRVEPGTRHIFVDVTGTNFNAVKQVLHVLAANLAERSRSKRVGLVHVTAPWGHATEPSMKPRSVVASSSAIGRLLGIGLRQHDLAYLLRRARMDVEVLSDSETLIVHVPAYRVDVLTWADVAEEVAIVLGIDVFSPRRPSRMLRGRLLGYRAWERAVRLLLVGLGFNELLTFTLTPCSLAKLFTLEGDPLKLANPVGPETGCYRTTIVAGLLRAVAKSAYKLPVKIFEVGDVAYSVNGYVAARKRLGIVYANEKAGYEDIQAYVYSILRAMGDEVIRVEPVNVEGLINGRAARIETKQGLSILLGEVSPKVLVEIYGIEAPVAVAEVDYTVLAKKAGWATAVPRP